MQNSTIFLIAAKYSYFDSLAINCAANVITIISWMRRTEGMKTMDGGKADCLKLMDQ